MSEPILDNAGSENFFKNIWKSLVEPEISRRKTQNNLKNKIPNLVVIRFPPEDEPQVYFDRDRGAGIYLIVKVNKGGIKKHDPIYMDQVSKYVEIKGLPKVIQKNDGYILMLRHNDTWYINFNLMTWKGEMKEKYDIIEEFIQVSKYTLRSKLYHAFIENLHSASELLIDVKLLLYNSERTKLHHERIDFYQKHKYSDDDGERLLTNHIELSKLRKSARYAENKLNVDKKMYENMFEIVETAHQNLSSIVPAVAEFNGKLTD